MIRGRLLEFEKEKDLTQRAQRSEHSGHGEDGWPTRHECSPHSHRPGQRDEGRRRASRDEPADYSVLGTNSPARCCLLRIATITQSTTTTIARGRPDGAMRVWKKNMFTIT